MASLGGLRQVTAFISPSVEVIWSPLAQTASDGS